MMKFRYKRPATANTSATPQDKEAAILKKGRIKDYAVKVRNLKPQVPSEILAETFAQFGKVKRCLITQDGTGIVIFKRKKCAESTIKRLTEGVFLMGTSLKPITAEALQENDEKEPESAHSPTWERERESRFALPGSLEYQLGRFWQRIEQIEGSLALMKKKTESAIQKIEYQMEQARHDISSLEDEMQRDVEFQIQEIRRQMAENGIFKQEEPRTSSMMVVQHDMPRQEELKANGSDFCGHMMTGWELEEHKRAQREDHMMFRQQNIGRPQKDIAKFREQLRMMVSQMHHHNVRMEEEYADNQMGPGQSGFMWDDKQRVENAKYKDGGKVGLRNLGNTCLSNTRQLLEWCLDERYLQDINTTTSNMKGSLIKAYANLIKSMWMGKTEGSVSPDAFKTQIGNFAPRFMGYAQQDSQEFLRYLLEGLHNDVNRITKKPAPIILDDKQLEKRNDSGKAQEYWKAYLNRDNSMIVDIFVGQLKSELNFASCGHRSVTFDPFWDLSIPVVKGPDKLRLDDCIQLFIKEELAAEESPMCTKCMSRKSCTKSFSIQRFPKILVLHLKRCNKQERFGHKLATLVEFPIENLDMSEYAADTKAGQQVRYDLFAVSNHSGDTSSGHYTAYCRSPYTDEWNNFNDARVSRIQSNQVVSSEAYVLFYELSS